MMKGEVDYDKHRQAPCAVPKADPEAPPRHTAEARGGGRGRWEWAVGGRWVWAAGG